jgi:SH3-like domain-containing protein
VNRRANCPYQVINTGDATGIWMYEDPDISATQVMAIPTASKGLVVDRCLTGWCHLIFHEKSGWVESSHIQPTCN